MKVAIGKFGKSILFDESKWGPIGGDCEAPIFYKCLAKYYPEITFYMIGKSDIYKMSKSEFAKNFPNKNMIDAAGSRTATEDEEYMVPDKILDGVDIDFGMFFSGPVGNANIPNFIPNISKAKAGQKAICLEMFKRYAAPIVYFLNKRSIPYFTLTPDPRYHPIRGRDLFNVAKFSLSQMDTNNMSVKHVKSQDDMTVITTVVPTIYSRFENMFLYGMDKPSVPEKTSILSMVMNEGGNGGTLRGPILEEYVLGNKNIRDDLRSSFEVFGKWDDTWMKKYKQFKGTVPYYKIWNIIGSSKYSFLIPIAPGWCTAKVWESIYCGTIPFLHPTYDQNKHLDGVIPDFLRTKSPKDFAEKMEELEKDPIAYNQILKYIISSLKDEYFDGRHICEMFRKGSEDLGFKIKAVSEYFITEKNNEISKMTFVSGPFSSILSRR